MHYLITLVRSNVPTGSQVAFMFAVGGREDSHNAVLEPTLLIHTSLVAESWRETKVKSVQIYIRLRKLILHGNGDGPFISSSFLCNQAFLHTLSNRVQWVHFCRNERSQRVNLYKTLLLWLAHGIYKNPTSIIINEFMLADSVADSVADSYCVTPYTIGLWRKLKWFPGLQLYSVALCDTVNFDHVTSCFLLCPLLYGVALSDSVEFEATEKKT